MWLWDGVVTCWEGGKVCGCEMGLLPAGRGKSVAVRWGCYLLGGRKGMWL